MPTSYPQNHKFRPYFTVAELLELTLALKQNPTPKRMGLITYIEGFILKIHHGQITSQHTIAPTWEQKLGFSPEQEIPISHNLTGEAAYQKQLINPGKCTPKEISESLNYRYINKLMSPTEESNYENSQGFTI